MTEERTYKDRIKPKSRKEVLWVMFLVLIASMAFLSPFYGEYKEVKGRDEIQQDIIKAIEHQDTVEIGKLTIVSAMGNHNRFSVVFPPKEG